MHRNEFLAESLNEERQTMQKRIEEVVREKAKIEKQLITLAHQKDEAGNMTKAKDEKIALVETQLAEVMKELERTRQLTRAKES